MSDSPYDKRTNLVTITEILLQIASQYRVTILVDGLDECEQRRDILGFLRQLGRKGGYLNVLVSSRDEFDIREALSAFPRLRLETASASLDHDIGSYINHRLSHDREFKWLKETFRLTIQERLSSQAKGM